jgi:hypothetical protein
VLDTFGRPLLMTGNSGLQNGVQIRDGQAFVDDRSVHGYSSK